MEVRIEILPKKILVGKSIRMSLIDNKTREVWHSFMSERGIIKNSKGSNLYSIQVYDDLLYFKDFSPLTAFTKWAATEVVNLDNVPNGFDSFTLKGGKYAVFLHKGPVSEFHKTAQYIFEKWLPKSEYLLDNRPHFELLGKQYKKDDPNSEEKVWIPVKNKS